MPGWLIWALAAVLLAVGEVFTPGLFFLGPVALAAVAAGVAALVGLGLVVQLLVFIAGSVASVLVLRPIARAHLHMPAALRTGTAALEGAKAATYEIANYIQGIEQLTVTTLRNVIGGMALEKTLTSRDEINNQLRGVLDEATGKWGIRVNRVELKAIDPPASIKETMEKQMRADREKRAAILTAEGVKQSQILTAEGEKQSAILRAEGQRQAAILQAEGQAKAIDTVFRAIHEGDPDPKLLAYQYLQVLPQIAQGESNKVWIIPSEVTQALGHLGAMLPGANSEKKS